MFLMLVIGSFRQMFFLRGKPWKVRWKLPFLRGFRRYQAKQNGFLRLILVVSPVRVFLWSK